MSSLSPNARPAAPAGRRRGFTIVEVVLAMGILMLGATAILGMLTFGAALTRSAQLRATAATAAEAVMADLEQVLFPYEDGEVGEPVEIVDREVPGAPGVVYSAHATVHPEDPLEYRVDVEMRWQSGGVQRARGFSTILLRELPLGERLRRDFVETRGRTPAGRVRR